MIDVAILFIIIFLFIIIVGISLIYSFDISHVEKFRLTITYLGGISVFLLTYNIYMNIRTNKFIEEHRIAYNTVENIKNVFLQPQKEIVEHFPEGYYYWATINPDSDLGTYTPAGDPAKREALEYYFSTRIFQAMEDFLSTAKYDLTDVPTYLNFFLTWIQSPILQRHWKIQATMYSPDTREFINTLIEKAKILEERRKIKGPLTYKDYDAVSNKITIMLRQSKSYWID